MESKAPDNQHKVIWTGMLTFMAAYFILKWWLPDLLATGIGVLIGMLIIHPFTSKPRMTSVKWIGVSLISSVVVLLISMGGEWLERWLPSPIANGLSLYIIFIAAHFVPFPGPPTARLNFREWFIYSIPFALLILLWIVISTLTRRVN